jgi:hypothetical protein
MDKRKVNLTKLGDSLPETENAELPLRSGVAGGDSMMPDDGGIPQLGKEKYDYRGKPDQYMGKPR